jgi:hypothetical protein
LNEIEAIRSGLDAKLVELERRVPPLVRRGRRVAVGLAGGGSGAVVLWAVKRARARRSAPAAAPAAGAPVAVNLLPKGAVPVAVAVVAVWAGVRIFEALQKRPPAEPVRPAVVTTMPPRSASS